MKTKLIQLSLFVGLTTISLSQSKPSIAVVNPSINEIALKPEVGAKMVRMELIKLEKYNVLDEFDMAETYKKDSGYYSCNGLSCLTSIGEELGVDYTVSASIDKLGNKTVIAIKIIDVNAKKIHLTAIREFDDQPDEIQRMIEVVVKDAHGIQASKELIDRLNFKNELITSNNVGRVKNSGPRIGVAFLTGSLHEYATREERQGGLDIFPAVSMIGYQIEGQYVGTENFSALIEGIFNISGLEQGLFIPSISIMNGFRFGKAGWEFAFGPGFGVSTRSKGFFDNEGLISGDKRYWSERDYNDYVSTELNNIEKHPEFFNEDGIFLNPTPSHFNEEYDFSKTYLDKRGSAQFTTSFVFAFGRTFRAGSLNIPVNIFYSSRKGGGYAGVNVGFNVIRSKSKINTVKKGKA